MKKLVLLIMMFITAMMLLGGCSNLTRKNVNANYIDLPSCPVGNSFIIKELNLQDNNALWSYFEDLYKYCLKIEVIKQELNNA